MGAFGSARPGAPIPRQPTACGNTMEVCVEYLSTSPEQSRQSTGTATESYGWGEIEEYGATMAVSTFTSSRTFRKGHLAKRSTLSPSTRAAFPGRQLRGRAYSGSAMACGSAPAVFLNCL